MLSAACGLSIASTVALAQGFDGHAMRGGFGVLRAGPFNANPKIQADRLAIEDALVQLRKDARAGNTSAVPQDQAQVMANFAQLQTDLAALHAAISSSSTIQAAETTLRADRVQLERDQLQLETDRIARNSSAAQADQAAITADQTKMKADRKALADAIVAITL
jgi:hypothetical protein